MPAAYAVVNEPVLVYPNSAINSRDKIFIAILAKPFLKGGIKPYFMLHCNPSCNPYIFIRKPAIILEHFFSFTEQETNARFCYFLHFRRFFAVFLPHFQINKGTNTKVMVDNNFIST